MIQFVDDDDFVICATRVNASSSFLYIIINIPRSILTAEVYAVAYGRAYGFVISMSRKL